MADRKPFSKFAIEIFVAAENKEIKLFVSSHSVATAHYLLKKYVGEKELKEILSGLLNYLTVISIDIDIIKRSLKSKHKDFEDAIQIVAAQSIEKIDCIVTRHAKDFGSAEIQVLPPDEFVKTYL
jgi:predicted nucleic acid-binding protein